MTRLAVPNRRLSQIVDFSHDGINYQGQVSYLMDGTPVEVFLEGGKSGTAIQSVARDSAVAVSIALQFNANIRTIRDAMTRTDDGGAAGPLGKLLDIFTEVQNG